jgi:protein tyrosine/serine phosphatase
VEPTPTTRQASSSRAGARSIEILFPPRLNGAAATRLLSALLLLLCLGGCLTLDTLIRGYDPTNFHIVEEGQWYRSAQLKAGELRARVERHGLLSVINLRGARPGEEWYDEEVEVVNELGLQHTDVSWTVRSIPTRRELLRFLDAVEELPRPTLVHCEAGADRSGLASALYGMIELGWDKNKALSQLTVRTYHVADRWPAMTYFVREVWQGAEGARENYQPCQADYQYFDTERYCPE